MAPTNYLQDSISNQAFIDKSVIIDDTCLFDRMNKKFSLTVIKVLKSINYLFFEKKLP